METNIHAPKGFQVTGLASGIKAGGQKDLAVIYSETPCQVAGAFTTNQVKAAPVLYDQKIVQGGGTVRAVVANSGNANACTGAGGMDHARKTAQAAGELFAGTPEEVLVLSTGVIGVPLPIDKILSGLKQAASQLASGTWEDAAEAITTTDTHPKIASLRSPEGYTITGIAKGAGMISPNMATMLAVICTDAALSPELLAKIPEVWDQSFNRIVVDGDMSTNDSVLLLANGASGVEVDLESDFFENCLQVSAQLAKEIVSDGEGATKLVTVNITGADSPENAEKIARAIATSPLCKTAFYGADPNWGRIICAAGYAGASFDPEKASLFLGNQAESILIFHHGQGTDYDEAQAIALMQTDAWQITLDLGLGETNTWLWTCDLSHEYVTINGHYRT